MPYATQPITIAAELIDPKASMSVAVSSAPAAAAKRAMLKTSVIAVARIWVGKSSLGYIASHVHWPSVKKPLTPARTISVVFESATSNRIGVMITDATK
jgi:hypothetical protein